MKELLTAQELAEILKLSVDTIWRCTREKRIPAVELGPRQYRYEKDAKRGHLSKSTFDAVMHWGFGQASKLEAASIERATGRAFDLPQVGKVVEAAQVLCSLKGVGISRATKVIALSDQTEYGIYDSRAAHGLSDLCCNQRRLIPVPPGRAMSVRCDHGDSLRFCKAYPNYLEILRYFRDRAKEIPEYRRALSRAADIEMALFARSRNGLVQ